MREFGIINVRFWEWIRENKISDTSKIIAAFLLSCNHGNSLGCFKCPIAYISEDLEYSIDRVSKAYNELIDKGFLIYCKTSKFVFLPKYLKWNPIQNRNHGKGTLKIALSLPSCFKYYDKLIKSLDKYSNDKMNQDDLKKGIETLSKRVYDRVSEGLDNGYGNTDTDTDTDKDKDTKDISPEQRRGIFIHLLLNDKSEYPVTKAYVSELQELYPALDVKQEFRKMKAWLDSNNRNRKTKTGIKRFITNWLSRAQNKAPKVPGTVSGASTDKKSKNDLLFEARDIFNKKGKGAFLKFAEENKFSENDKNSILDNEGNGANNDNF